MSSKWRNRILILIGIIVLVFILRMTVFAPEPLEISVFTVENGRVEETVTNSKAGTVKVRKRAKLSPEIGGRVVYIGAKEGQTVEAGSLLLRLEDSDFKANLVLSERANQAALAAMKEACVAASLAERDLKRNQALNQQGVISDAILDASENKSEVSRARCEASKSEAKRAEAAVEVARANLKKTEIRAPFSGVIAQLTTELGEFITPSPPGVPIPPVIDLLDNEGAYVEAPIDETDAGKLRAGLPVRVHLDPYPDQTFDAVLSTIATFVQDIEGQNRTVDVEAEFDDSAFAKTLLPGTSADVEIILNVSEGALRIPTYGLMEGGRVLVIENDILVARKVSTGLRNWDFVEIRDGLKAGEKIALSLDLAEVKEGVLVRAKEEEKK